VIEFVVPLPPSFRADEVRAFHGRDPEQLAERWDGATLSKGLMLGGRTGVLTVTLDGDVARGRFDGEGAVTEARLVDMVVRMLGLHLESAPFEARFRDDAVLGPLIARQTGLRIPQAATAFEALTWAITGQQINLALAITLRGRLIELVGRPHGKGLWCYPDARQLAVVDPEELGRRKFTRAKSETLVRVARLVADGELDLEALAALPAEEAERRLTALKGIGPWTAHYTLLRGLGMADCSLQGDVAVRNALTAQAGLAKRLSIPAAAALLQNYAPYRSLAAAHLWASLQKAAA
jgi:DNA-3-methyladenine glycosylase II